MKVSELEKQLKAIKNIIDYKKEETEIAIIPRQFFPAEFNYEDATIIKVMTQIDGYRVNLTKDIADTNVGDRIKSNSITRKV